MEVDETGVAARLRVIARRAYGDAFVQRQNVLQIRVIRQRPDQRILGGSGIAKDVPDAMGG